MLLAEHLLLLLMLVAGAALVAVIVDRLQRAWWRRHDRETLARMAAMEQRIDALRRDQQLEALYDLPALEPRR